MEVHGYTPQGVRVLIPAPQGSQPEILERAASLNLSGLLQVVRRDDDSGFHAVSLNINHTS
jgi:hypothetical protein